VTHKTQRAALDQAIEAMNSTDVMTGAPVALRIEAV
jgi:homoserine dehydrogenase